MRADPLVITGLGVVSALGLGATVLHQALSSARPISLPATVSNLPAEDFLSSAQLRRMDRLSQMINIAGVMAAQDAGIEGGGEESSIVVGSGIGNMSESTQFLERVFRRPGLASPMLFPNLVLNAPAGQLAMALGWSGPNLTVSTGETSGEAALATGADLVRRGRARLALIVAADELADLVLDILSRLGVTAPAGAASRPFDQSAVGPVPGEGAAALVLELASSAESRGARALAVLDGVETVSLPALPFRWPRADSIPPLPGLKDFDVVFSGADSSPERDRLEGALLAGFPGLVTTWKGALGEFASSGLTGVVLAAESLQRGEIPPTLGIETPVVRDLRFVQESAVGEWETAAVTGVARGGGGVLVRLSRAM